MNDINTAIAQKVKDNSYFHDAMSWYMDKYNNTRSHIFFLSLYITMILVVMTLLLAALYSYFPLEKHYNFINIVNQVHGKIYSVEDIGQKEGGSANELLASYLLKKYVETRQSYDFNSYKNRTYIEYVRNNTDKRSYHEFIQKIRSSNPNSPVRVMGKRFVILTEVDSIKFLDDSKQADVYFTSYKIGVRDKKVYNTSNYKVQIEFELSDLETFNYENDKFKFIVSSYRLYDDEVGGKNEE